MKHIAQFVLIVCMNAASAIAMTMYGLQHIRNGHGIVGTFLCLAAIWPVALIAICARQFKSSASLAGMIFLGASAVAYAGWTLPMAKWFVSSLDRGETTFAVLAFVSWAVPISLVKILWMRLSCRERK